jgi:hypothetical protein
MANNGQTVVLSSDFQKRIAHRLIDVAPHGAILNVRQAGRTGEQNSKLWACISDVSRAKPEGRTHTAEVWKCLFMQACGHAVQFENGLNGQPFPIGFRSSRLTKSEMSDLIECVVEYGSRHGVEWSEPGLRNEGELAA